MGSNEKKKVLIERKMPKLLFRKFEDDELTAGSPKSIVDVHYNEDLIAAMSNTSFTDLTDTPIACIHWEAKNDPFLSTLTVSEPDSQGNKSVDKALCLSLLQNRGLFRDFIKGLYMNYDAKLISVKILPISFIVVYSERKLLSRVGNRIMSMIRGVFARDTVSSTEVKVKVKAREMSSSASPCTHLEQCFKTGTASSKTRSPQEKLLREKRFTKVEEQLSSQKQKLENQFLQHSNSLNDLNNRLERVATQLHELRSRETTNVSTGDDPLTSTGTSGTGGQSPGQALENDPSRARDFELTVASQTSVERSKRQHPQGDVPPRERLSTDDDEAMARRLQYETWGSTVPEEAHVPRELRDFHTVRQAGGVRNPPFRQILPPEFQDRDMIREREMLMASTQGSGFQSVKMLTSNLSEANPNDAAMWIDVREKMDQEANVPRCEMSLDTVLCLDTSGSIGDQGLSEIKTIVSEFITGIEKISESHHIEENVGLVTFGGVGRLIHRPTIDFSCLQDSLDTLTCRGKSPLHQGIFVSLTAVATGFVCNNGGPHVLHRIIVITDGIASTDSGEHSQDVMFCSQEEKFRLVKVVDSLGNSFGDRETIRFVWIPVGKADRNLLKSLAQLSKGEVVEGNRVKELCRFQLVRKTALTVMESFKGLGETIDSNTLDCTIDAISSPLTDEEREEVKSLVQAGITKGDNINYHSTESFDNINIEHHLPPLGTRVVRGPDWIWENQDMEMPGTIINHHHSGESVNVEWDYGHINLYRYGVNGAYDVLPDDSCPRQYQDPQSPEIGVQVIRGPDWCYEDQDGGPDSHGVIIRCQGRRVKVIWDNGSLHDYRFGADDHYDIVMRDAESCLLKASVPEDEFAKQESVPDDAVYRWQREEGGCWQDYSDTDNAKLMKAYKRGNGSSCLLRRGRHSYRVCFNQGVERNTTDNTETRIRKYIS